MQRLNFTLDRETVTLLSELAQQKFYQGNKSQTIRAALQSLATHTGHAGWVINGYTPTELNSTTFVIPVELNTKDCYTAPFLIVDLVIKP